MGDVPIQLRLLTIGASHYCERARWALDLSGARGLTAYTEEAHVPLLHIRAVKAVRSPEGSRSTSVPCALVVETGGGAGAFLPNSQAIVEFVDGLLPVDAKLYPQDLSPDERQRIRDIEEICDRKLGPHVRRWIYAHVLNDPRLGRLFLGAGCTSRLERATLAVARPLIARSMSASLKITPESAARSLAIVRDVFARLSALLPPSGEGFLVGGRFTSADLSFASLAAPVVFEPYGPGSLPLAAAPEALQREARALRETPAGRHVARTFALHRGRPPPPPLLEPARL
eukprot:tig00000144_g9069.t1